MEFLKLAHERYSCRSLSSAPVEEEKIEKILLAGQQYIDIVLPYNEAGKLGNIRNTGRLISEEYLPEGIHICAYVSQDQW